MLILSTFCMIKGILIATLLLAVISEETLGATESVQFNCSSQNLTLYFKTMREFTLVSDQRVEEVVISSPQHTCKLSNTTRLCTFTNMTKQLNVSCPTASKDKPQLVELRVERPTTLDDTEEANSSLVVLPLGQNQNGVLSLRLSNMFMGEIQQLGTTNSSNEIGFLLHSDCVDSIVLFEDHFRIAVTQKPNPCTVGLLNHTSSWKFYKSIYEIDNLANVHTGFLIKERTQNYTVSKGHSISNFTASLTFETEELEKIQHLNVTVEVYDVEGRKETFYLTNFEKGLMMFDVEIFFNRSISTLSLVSNYNMFYSLFFTSHRHNDIRIAEDIYLYLHLSKNKTSHFVVQLFGFEEQATNPRTIVFLTSQGNHLNFTYKECTNDKCYNTTAGGSSSNGQITPKCQHIINDTCFISVEVLGEQDGVVGILPLAYNDHVSLEINKIHSGKLQMDRLAHYMIKKEVLDKMSTEIIIVSVAGAKAYLTYNEKCRRISCADFWDISGSIEVPNEHKDLYIFVEGTSQHHYSLIVDTNDEGGFHLPEGLIIKGQLHPEESEKYYTYTLQNSSSFEINCNALPNTVLLLVNVKSEEFPLKGKADYSSKDCYVHVPKEAVLQSGVVHVSVERLLPGGDYINYSLLGVSEGSEIVVSRTEPFSDFFQPNSSKKFKYFIGQPTSDLYFKVDIYEQSKMTPLQVKFGDLKTHNYEITVADTNTFTIDLFTQQTICESRNTENKVEGESPVMNTDNAVGKANKEETEACYMYVIISNPGSVGLEVSILTWLKQQPIKLTMGEYQNFETGALNEETRFYIPIEDKTKPINIYISSNQVEIEALAQLWNANGLVPAEFWPFPSFSFLNKEVSSRLVYSFSAAIYFDTERLEVATQESVILLTIRDRTSQANRTVSDWSTAGNIQIAVSNGYLKMHEDQKFEYTIQNRETYSFEFPIGNLLLNENQEVYFHNLGLVGLGVISYHFDHQEFNETIANFSPDNLVIIWLSDYKNKTKKQAHSSFHSITFKVKCLGSSCRFLANIAASSSDYRQLTLGVPEQFYIAPHSKMVFQFNDFYDEDFKIKVQREEGFPEYRLLSCKPSESKIDCLKPVFHNTSEALDSNSLILSGRSHELKIDTKSEHYCKECIYYIVFYSHSEEVEGSLTITRPGQAVILKEGVPLTTELYSEDEDSYLISTLPKTARLISIIPHMGQISVELVEMYETAVDKQKHWNSTDLTSIEIEVEKTKTSTPYNLKVKSLDNQNAMYSIIVGSEIRMRPIFDGVPIKSTLAPNSDMEFKYSPKDKSIVLITSNVPLEVEVVCQNESQVFEMKGHVKHSQIFNITLFHLDIKECTNYIIQVTTKKQAHITIIANEQEIVLLPFETKVPAIVKKDACQIYEVPIQQKTHLRIVLSICKMGSAILGIAQDKHKLMKKQYTFQYEITGSRSNEVIEYHAKPGILYFEVHSESDSIEYTVQIFPFYGKTQIEIPITTLADGYIQTTPIAPDTFRLQFDPMVVTDSVTNYTVSYILLESNQRSNLRKSLRCQGTFFDILNPNTTLKETRLAVSQENGSLVANYTTTEAHSFVTIIPVIDPHLPAYATQPLYEISEMSSGKGPRIFEKMMSKLTETIENLTGIDDENTINWILVLVLVVGNVVLVSVCCCLSAWKCRKTIIIERNRLATTEREGRLSRFENSLDMLQQKEDPEKMESGRNKTEEVILEP